MLDRDKYSNISNCFKKAWRAGRLIIIWVLIYTICHVVVLKDIDILTGVQSIIHGFAGGYFYYGHLWYLYVTICLYIMTPILQIVLKKKEMLNYILLIWFVGSVSIPLITHYVKALEPNSYFNMNFLGGYLGYYLLGYKLGQTDIKHRNWVVLLFLAWIATSIICCLNMNYFNGDTYWQDFMSIGVVCMSVFLFVAIKQKFQYILLQEKTKTVLERLASISLGIYLLHFFIRDMFMQVYWTYIGIDWLYIIFEPIVVTVATIGITYLLSKIKPVKKHMMSL